MSTLQFFFFNPASTLQRVVLGKNFHLMCEKSVHLMTIHFINVRFIEIFYKSLTLNPSVHEDNIGLNMELVLRRCPLCRVSAL